VIDLAFTAWRELDFTRNKVDPRRDLIRDTTFYLGPMICHFFCRLVFAERTYLSNIKHRGVDPVQMAAGVTAPEGDPRRRRQPRDYDGRDV
jgi:hypothetical protein